MEREKTEMKREIVKELLFDRLYRCIEVNDDGIVVFDKFNLNNEDLAYMLREYDPEKFDTVVEIVRGGKNENIGA